MKINFAYFWVLLVLSTSACSSSKWVVENQFETDRSDFELIESVQFLQRVGTTTPNSPIVQFELKAANTFEYAQRVRTDRYIQRYKPSLLSILFGVAGAGLATSSAILVEPSTSTQNVLYGSAAFITLASFLNMNPSGQPTPTGETRLLRRTGRIQETDTVPTNPLPEMIPTYTIYDDQEILAMSNNLPFANGRYSVNLLESFNADAFDYDNDETINVEVQFNDRLYVEEVPVSSFLERFVVVSSEVTALRDEPVLDSRSILTDLAKGSQMRLVQEDSLWYKVLYGISETYIAKSDAYLIWRPSEFASQLSIITIPNIPFGNVDVERDIPALAERNDRHFALVLANREYQGTLSERSYAERDAQLIETYLTASFGLPNENIQKSTNVETQQQLRLAYNRFANTIRNQQEQLIVYVSGYVREGDGEQIEFLGTNNGTSANAINLNSFLNGLSSLPVEEMVFLLDIDNIDERSENKIIEKLANQIVSENKNAAIIVSSTENQRSRNYSTPNGDQKRHSIFTYFIADAIKKGATSVSQIVNHLQRNVDYTSRRLHNQPQHILFFGNGDIRLTE